MSLGSYRKSVTYNWPIRLQDLWQLCTKARYTLFLFVLLALFRHSILESITATSSSKRREQMWIAFGQLRGEKLFGNNFWMVLDAQLSWRINCELSTEFLVQTTYTCTPWNTHATSHIMLTSLRMNFDTLVGMLIWNCPTGFFIKDHVAKLLPSWSV